MTDFRQTPAWCQYFATIGWKSELVGNSYALIRPLPLIGSIIKLHRPLYPLPLGELEGLAKKHRALLVKLELDEGLDKAERQQLQSYGYQKDNWPLLATKTVRIDLTPSANELLTSFRSDTRYLIRKAARQGVVTKTHRGPDLNQQELKAFYTLMNQLAKPGRFTVPTYEGLLAKTKGFGKSFLFTTAYHQNQFIAGAATILHPPTAFFHHLASAPLGRKKFAAYAIVWNILQTTQQLGYTSFDMDGIYDPRDPKRQSWKQFSIFKTKFGGEEVELPLSRTKYFTRWLKVLSKLK